VTRRGSRLAVGLVALAALGCAELPEEATGLRIVVTSDAANEIDEVFVHIADGAGRALYAPQAFPDEPRALDPLGERLELVLDEDLAGTAIAVRVDGYASSTLRAAARASTALERGRFVTVELFLEAYVGVCGDGAVDEPIEECDDGDELDGDGCGSFCLQDPAYACEPGEPCLVLCEPGTVHVYEDGDGDGVGTGEASAECLSLPLEDGVSEVGTDCDDTDERAWRAVVAFPDEDADTVTAAGEDLCVDDGELEWPYVADASWAPFRSFYGAAADVNDSMGTLAWTNAARAIYPDDAWARARGVSGTSNYLVVTGFGLQVPAAANVTGVVVVVRHDADLNGEPEGRVTDAAVRLVVGGQVQGDDHASASEWSPNAEWVTYGAADDDWGTTLTGADVTADDFGVAIAVDIDDQTGGVASNAEVDVVEILVHTDAENPDCNDNDNSVVSSVLLAPDVDGDFAPTSNTGDTTCVDDTLPFALAQVPGRGLDCDDANANAYPGQTAYFEQPGFDDLGDPVWDFDCDGTVEKRALEVPASGTFCMCAVDDSCVPTNPVVTTPAEDCGVEIDTSLCFGACAFDPDSCGAPLDLPTRVACR
jgi:cysteine-rich repeat protein